MTKRTRVAAFCGALALLTGAAAARAQERESGMTGIVVQGTGEVRVKPDVANIQLGVQTSGRDSTAAAQENARKTEQVIAAVRAAGVAEKDIQTANYSIYPQYDNRPPRPLPGGQETPQTPQIIGYQVNNSVNVTVRRIGDVGKVIDAGIKAGANVAGGISFSLDDPTSAKEEAMKKAVADAMRKAKVIADAAGVGSTRLVAITEGSVNYPRPMYDMAMTRGAMAAEASTPVSPGEQTITVTVTARYSMSGQQ